MKMWVCIVVCAVWTCDASFLIVSSSTEGQVYSSRLLTATEMSRGDSMSHNQLSFSSEFSNPMGVACDHSRHRLYVADPGKSAIMVGNLVVRNNRLRLKGVQELVSDVNVEWVAVNAVGTLFYTESSGNVIWSLNSSAISARVGMDTNSTNSTADPVALYTATDGTPVHTPQGVASNEFYVVWANSGNEDAVVQGREETDTASVSTLASGVAYGVCLTSSRIFYTAESNDVYSVDTTGADLVTVTDELQSPRGCVYDGDGTVFVADHGDGKVYEFSGGSSTLGARQLSLALEVTGAYGLTVYHGGSTHVSMFGAVICTLLVVLGL